MFSRFDADGNGDLTRDELKTAFKLFGLDAGKDEELLNKVFERVTTKLIKLTV
jgi:Ca2+-binding EF-hand superfamily protein